MIALDTLEAQDRTLRLCQAIVLRPGAASDMRVARQFLDTTVVLIADERNLASAACQSAICALARLVVGYGCSLRLVMPDVPIAGHQPPLRGSRFRTALLDLALDTVPGVRADVAHSSRPEDLGFVFGDSNWSGTARQGWRVSADPWCGSIGPITCSASRFKGDFPLGGLAAAALASAEPFKAALRDLGVPLRCAEQLAPIARATFRLAPRGTPSGAVDLGSFDCVSGGAIINAALFALLRLPGVRGDARILEPQLGELSNLNRYVLMRRATCRLSKIKMLAEWSSPGFLISGRQIEVGSESRAEWRALRDQVLVGVDRVSARWFVQSQWPEWLAVGGTDDMFVMVSEHTPGDRCAGCASFAAVEGAGQPIPTVSFVSFWAGLLTATRLTLRALGVPNAPSEQLCELTPLRLDSPFAARSYRVPNRADCPVGHSASQDTLSAAESTAST